MCVRLYRTSRKLQKTVMSVLYDTHEVLWT